MQGQTYFAKGTMKITVKYCVCQQVFAFRFYLMESYLKGM